MTTSTTFSVDVRLINTRKELAIKEIKGKGLSAYDQRSALIKLEWKVEVILEALKGLHDLGIANTYNLGQLWNEFEGIAKSAR